MNMKPITPEEVPQGAVTLIAKWEKLIPHFYFCPAKKLTVGYGHVVLKEEIYNQITSEDILFASKVISENTATSKGASNILKAIYGNVVTGEEALKLLKEDIAKHWNEFIPYVKVNLNIFQKVALMSFVFNLGVTKDVRESTLLRLINQSDFKGAKKEFARWIYSGGSKLKGLENRRAEEAELFGSKLV